MRAFCGNLKKHFFKDAKNLHRYPLLYQNLIGKQHKNRAYSENGKPSVSISEKRKGAVVAFYGRSTIQTVVELVVLRPFLCRKYRRYIKQMQQQKLTLIFDGDPNINALPESEQRVFYTTLLERIFELYRAKDKDSND